MADHDSMGPSIQLVEARSPSREFKLRGMSILHDIQNNGHISLLLEATVTHGRACWQSSMY